MAKTPPGLRELERSVLQAFPDLTSEKIRALAFRIGLDPAALPDDRTPELALFHFLELANSSGRIHELIDALSEIAQKEPDTKLLRFPKDALRTEAFRQFDNLLLRSLAEVAHHLTIAANLYSFVERCFDINLIQDRASAEDLNLEFEYFSTLVKTLDLPAEPKRLPLLMDEAKMSIERAIFYNDPESYDKLKIAIRSVRRLCSLEVHRALQTCLEIARAIQPPSSSNEAFQSAEGQMVPLDARPGQFVPSEALVNMLYDGMVAHYENLRSGSPREALDPPTKQRAAAILAPRLFEVIASRARRIRRGLLPAAPLAVGNSFDYGFVLELTEHLPIRIDAATAFFRQLHHDMAGHLRRGGRISGRWGKIVMNEQQINFDLGGSIDGTSTSNP
jgi:hypothetical protein